MYVNSLLFITAAAIMFNGPGLTSQEICKATIYLCIAFYVISKLLMCYFLIERVHAVRGPYTTRLTDSVWCFFMVLLAVGIAAIASIAFYKPVIEWAEGTCRFGLTPGLSIGLCIYDVVINFALTIIFVWLFQPLLAFGRPTNVPQWKQWMIRKVAPYAKHMPLNFLEVLPYRQTLTRELVNAREKVVKKTLVGSVLIVIPTVVNMTILYVDDGKELGWLCLTLCIIDGWSALF